MKVKITFDVNITLLDEDVGDPVKGDPMEGRMIASAVEAVQNAFDQANGAGFVHDLDTLTGIEVGNISGKRIKS